MRPRSVLVAWRQRLVGEGIAAGLVAHPWISVAAVTCEAQEAEEWGPRVDAAAVDASLPNADRLAAKLRRDGVRVIVLGDDRDVSLDAPIATLAWALVPAVHGRNRPRGPLSPRQREVLELIGRGLAAKQVARHLGISAKTVEHHKTSIYSKLGVPNQAAAVRVGLSTGEGAAR